MLAAGTALCAISLGTTAAGIASATVSEPTCHGDIIVQLDHSQSGHPYSSTVHELGTTLVAGTYEAMAIEIHSGDSEEEQSEELDGYDDSDNDAMDQEESTSTTEDEQQLEEEDAEGSEYWEVQFLDGEGNVVGETMVLLSHHHDPVVDLGTMVLDASAVEVSLAEIKDYGSDHEIEDLHHVRCLGLSRLPDPTTTTSSTTTSSTITSTTTAPTTTTTATPAVTAATNATTTTAPAAVAPAVRANTLPVTGSDTGLLVVAGAASMMLGTGLILGSRRREV